MYEYNVIDPNIFGGMGKHTDHENFDMYVYSSYVLYNFRLFGIFVFPTKDIFEIWAKEKTNSKNNKTCKLLRVCNKFEKC